jgi:hypothetical protein
VDQDIETAHTIHDGLHDVIDSFARADVRLHYVIHLAAARNGPCGGDHSCAASNEAIHDGFADAAFGPASYKDSSAFELSVLILHKRLLTLFSELRK